MTDSLIYRRNVLDDWRKKTCAQEHLDSLNCQVAGKKITQQGEDDACKESAFGREHWNNAVITGDSIDFGGKTLLATMSVKARVNATQNGSSSAAGYFPNSYDTVTTNQKVAFGSLQIASNCWRDHTGGYRVGITVDYAGKSYGYWAAGSHGWGGNGDGMYVDRIDNF